MLKVFKRDYPNLIVIGHRNGYFSEEDEQAIQEDIREKNPDFVFIGITSPKKNILFKNLWIVASIRYLWELAVVLMSCLVISNEHLYGCKSQI